jgi:hypothetical protein
MNNKSTKSKEKEQPDDLEKKEKILKTQHKKHCEKDRFEEMLEEIQDDELYHMMRKFK